MPRKPLRQEQIPRTQVPRRVPADYDCVDAWISPTISPRPGKRRSARYEKIVLPSSTTSSTPFSAKLIFGERFNWFLISRLRRTAPRRRLIQVTQRLISMVKTPPFRRRPITARHHERPVLAVPATRGTCQQHPQPRTLHQPAWTRMLVGSHCCKNSMFFHRVRRGERLLRQRALRRQGLWSRIVIRSSS